MSLLVDDPAIDGEDVKPYYADEYVTLYHGDCREILPALGDGIADCIVADPPYEETSLDWDKRVRGWTPFAWLALKPTGSLWLFGSLRAFLRTAGDFSGWRVAQEVVWEKHNGSNAAADRFRRVHELALQMYRIDAEWGEVYKAPVYTQDATKRAVRRKGRPVHWGAIGPSQYESHDGGPRLMRSVIRVRSEHGRAVHPTQKPVGIVTPLIEYSCPVGGMVLDPMAGAGTTLVAAKEMGRRAIGIEINKRHCASAARRLSQCVLNLGGAA